MSATGSQIVQQFCIKGERVSKCNSIALNRAVKKKKESIYTNIFYLYTLKKRYLLRFGEARPLVLP